jgi:hypothetical protein
MKEYGLESHVQFCWIEKPAFVALGLESLLFNAIVLGQSEMAAFEPEQLASNAAER